jgi:hypothetical protein
MKELLLEQPQEVPLFSDNEKDIDAELAVILANAQGTSAEEFVRRFIVAEKTEQKDQYAKEENKKLYLKEKIICIEALQNMRQGEVANILIQRLHR